MIKELIPKIGDRAKFKSNLAEWRNVINITTNSTPFLELTAGIDIDDQSTFSLQQNTESTSLIDLNSDVSTLGTLSTTESSSSSTTRSPSPLLYTLNRNSETFQLQNLHEFLRSTVEGRALLALYKDSGILDNSGRRKLCNIIVRRELDNDPEKIISSQRLLSISQEIITTFTKEHISTYFIPYISYGPTLKKAAKGKLLDCFNNRRREYKKAGIITSRRSNSGQLSRLSPGLDVNSAVIERKDIEEPLAWLKNSSDPWYMVEDYWSITESYRIQRELSAKSKGSVSDYMKEFPCLKKPSGYTLLLKDFCYIYPQNKECLFENFPIYKAKLLELAKTTSTTLRDTTLKNIIKEYLDLAPDSEETSSLAALLVLPFLFSPVSTKRKKCNTVCWRPSKIEMRDGFILHIHSQAELQEAITRRKEKYVKLGLTLQPMVIVVGPKISEINQYFVTIDDTFYELHSIVSAVDCCFKVTHALNAEYPTECLPIWTFIQKAFYKIKTTYDTEYVTVNSLISDLEIQE